MCDLIMTPGKLDTQIYIYKGDGLKYVEQVWVDVKKDEDCELPYCAFHRVHNELKFPRPLTHEFIYISKYRSLLESTDGDVSASETFRVKRQLLMHCSFSDGSPL